MDITDESKYKNFNAEIVLFMNWAIVVLVEVTVRRLPILGQSILLYRCLLTTGKCIIKALAATSIPKRYLYSVGATCSGTAGILFFVSSAASILTPNISFPLMAIYRRSLSSRRNYARWYSRWYKIHTIKNYLFIFLVYQCKIK